MPLSSFRENLEKLLEDKHFKEEIVHFNISEEKGVVEASHRARLIPLLMRYATFDEPLMQNVKKSELYNQLNVTLKFSSPIGRFSP